MKTSLRLIACALLLFGALVMSGLAQQKGPHEAEFRTFYAAFVKAVQANDKEKIADMIAYPVSPWSIQTKGDVQEGSIKDKADFLARFNVLFTNYMGCTCQKRRCSRPLTYGLHHGETGTPSALSSSNTSKEPGLR